MMSPSMVAQQTATLSELYAQELPGLVAQTPTLPEGIQRVYALGNGDSHHAALAAAQAFSAWTDIDYRPMPAYTFVQHELPRLRPQDAARTLVVCISASGSSKLAVSALSEVRGRGLGATLSMTGKPGSAMDQAAEYTLSTIITEKGRSPGIRTYAASLCGLLCLAGRLGQCEDRLLHAGCVLQTEAPRLDGILSDSVRAAEAAAHWDWPLCTVLGCDGLFGCAHFAAAKLVETSGVFASGQEMEEWCHVESMAYPLNAPVIILLGSACDREKALSVMNIAHRAGRRTLLISAFTPDDALRAGADEHVFLSLHVPEALNPLFLYMPLLPLAQRLAEKEGRAMFLSDQPFRLF